MELTRRARIRRTIDPYRLTCSAVGQINVLVSTSVYQHADASHRAGLLRMCRNRPNSRRTAQQRYKLPSASGLSGEGQAVLCVQTAKKHPFSLTQNQPPKTGKVAA